jgi:predicted GIY-YIG superfamily endonuclease
MVFIYILQLEEGKYYVGKTNNPSFRIEKHLNYNGSAWTKKYKPISVIDIIPKCDDYDEDKYTIKYMEKYGIKNVRGGSFCQINLNDNNIITLNQMILGVTDKCYICGKCDHFANDCIKISIKKDKKLSIDLNEKCDCISSHFSQHRRGNCLLNKMLSYFDDEDDDIDKLLMKQQKK